MNQLAASPAAASIGLVAAAGEGGFVRRHPVASFVALTYGLSWLVWFGLAVTGTSIATPAGAVLNVVATAGPSMAAIVLALVLGGGELRRLLGGFSPRLASPTWVVVAIVLPLVMVVVAIAISVGAMGGAIPVISASLAGVIVAEWLRVLVLGGPLEEELGWRGFALPRLQAGRSAWDAALALGVIWGVWHIPLYLVPGTGQYDGIGGDLFAGAFTIGAFIVWTIGLSVLFAWLFNLTRGSLIVVMLLHASVNLGSFIPAAVESSGAAPILYALVTWAVAIAVVWRFSRVTLAGSRPPASRVARGHDRLRRHEHLDPAPDRRPAGAG